MSLSSELFNGQSYINLETYRKTGEAVHTPVWFAQEGDCLYVWTYGSSGKVKRIRRNSQVKVVPSDGRGTPKAGWVSGEAEIAAVDTPLYQQGNQLINRKYGLMKRFFELMGRKNKNERVIIRIHLNGN